MTQRGQFRKTFDRQSVQSTDARAPTNVSASVEALLGVIEFWVAIDARSRAGSPTGHEAALLPPSPNEESADVSSWLMLWHR